jgi:hypothetical protein
MSETYLRNCDLSFLSRCTDRVRRAYDYWNEKRGERTMPSRADIDPGEIRDLLPGIILVDVQREPFRLTYRLVGTDEVQARGQDPTGKDVKEHVFASVAEEGYKTYCLAAEMKVPIYDEEPTDCSNQWLREAGSLVMPLSSDGETVDKLMAFIDYRRRVVK